MEATKRKRFISILLTTLIFVGFTSLQAMETEKIEQQVKRNVGMISDNKIDVKVEDNGTVVLQGSVVTLYDKMAKHQAASKVDGVEVIKNQIVVDAKPAPARMIEYNIKRDLRDNVYERPKTIQVTVNDEGIVFLSGEVRKEKSKIAAESVAAWQKGVKGVINEIEVKM